MIPHERIPYSAIVDRPKLKLPGDARLVVWPIVNVENWDIGGPMPRQVLTVPSGVSALPDIPNWAWHEYGMRVGFWRLKAALDRHGIRPTLSINSSVCTVYPRIAGAARDAGWDFMGHGVSQVPMHKLADQRAAIDAAIAEIAAFTGQKPRGWLGPGLTETAETIDLLKEAGLDYVGDWVVDEQPCEIATRAGPIVGLPYTVELNDIPMMMIQHHRAAEFYTRGVAQFRRLYEDAADSARIMSIAVHPYITGVPHRIGWFERLLAYLARQPGVVFWTGAAIVDWYRGTRSNSRQA